MPYPKRSISPIPSSAPGKSWNPIGVLMVLGGLGTLATTIAFAWGPIISSLKPDLSGYVKREAMSAELKKRDDEWHRLDERTRKAEQAAEACAGQVRAVHDLFNSKTPKAKRKPLPPPPAPSAPTE